MALFGKKSKDQKELTAKPLADIREPGDEGAAAVIVLGSGCAKCEALEAATREALEKLGMDTTVAHERDFARIAAYGVMTTPALVVDGKVLSYGRVLKTDEVMRLISQARKA